MRLFLRRPLAVALVGAALLAAGCNQLSGVSDYKMVDLLAVPCAVNAECTALAPTPGHAYVCRKDEGHCVELTSPDCPEVDGDYANDDAFVFASLLPTTNGAGEPGAGRPLLNAVRLAMRELADVNGLPPLPGSSVRRPLAMLSCDDKGNKETAERAAAHAIGAGLPAILGPMFSGLTFEVATNVVIPSGNTFQLSPTAAATTLTDLADGGLVWRLAPTTDVQAQALASLTKVFENDPGVRDELGVDRGDGKVRVALVAKGDPFGQSLRTSLRSQLYFNGLGALVPENNPYFREQEYGNPDAPGEAPLEYERVVNELVAYRPHFVFLLGVEEINTEILPRLEGRWVGGERPYYFAAAGPYAMSLFSFVKQSDPAWGVRRRVFGVVPGTNGDLFRKFRLSYGATNDISEADTSGPAQAYDSLYVLAFAAAAAGGEAISGPVLAGQMARVVDPNGVVVSAGPERLLTSLDVLAGGGSINFNGASGLADFNLETGDLKSAEMQIWCIGPEGTGRNSSASYNTTSGAFSGSMSTIREECNRIGVGAPVGAAGPGGAGAFAAGRRAEGPR